MAGAIETAFVEILPTVDAAKFDSEVRQAVTGPIQKAGRDAEKALNDGVSAGLGDGVDKAGKASEGKIKGLAGRVKGALGGVGGSLAAGFAAGFAVDAVVGQISDAVSKASDLQETLSKTTAIFGDEAARSLEEFANGAADAIGQSKQAALDASATFGVFGKGAGLAGDDLVGFSTDLTVLASDLASFGNTTPEQAVEALGGALRGEAEGLRAYGVLLNEDAINAAALAAGIVKPIKSTGELAAAQLKAETAQKALSEAQKKFGKDSLEAAAAAGELEKANAGITAASEGVVPPLTAQQKVLATQAAIFAQTADAQGDFAKTSDGLANTQRTLTAKIDNLKTSLGSALLPVVLLVAQGIEKVVTVLGSVGDIARSVAGFVKDNAAAFGVLGATLAILNAQLIATKVAQLALKVASLAQAAATTVLTVAQRALNLAFLTSPIGLIVAAIGLLVAGFLFAYKNSEQFREAVQGIVEKIKDFGATVLAVGASALEFLKGVFTGIKDALVAVFDFLKNAIVAYVTGYIAVVTTVVSFFLELPGKIGGALSAVFETVKRIFNSIKDTVSRLITDTVNAVVNAVTGLPGKIKALGGKMLDAGKALLNGLIDGIKGVGGFVGDIAQSLGRALRGVVNTIVIRPINSALRGVVSGINKIPGVNINAPQIRELARGAVVNSPTLALVGEAGREVVIPLTKPARAVELARQSGLMDILAARSPASSGGSPAVRGGTVRNITNSNSFTIVTPSDDAAVLASQLGARLAAASER